MPKVKIIKKQKNKTTKKLQKQSQKVIVNISTGKKSSGRKTNTIRQPLQKQPIIINLQQPTPTIIQQSKNEQPTRTYEYKTPVIKNENDNLINKKFYPNDNIFIYNEPVKTQKEKGFINTPTGTKKLFFPIEQTTRNLKSDIFESPFFPVEDINEPMPTINLREKIDKSQTKKNDFISEKVNVPPPSKILNDEEMNKDVKRVYVKQPPISPNTPEFEVTEERLINFKKEEEKKTKRKEYNKNYYEKKKHTLDLRKK
jgi:hypothetical protein